MKYTQYDYHAAGADAEGMAAWWADHWEGRSGVRADLTDQPLWPTIEDIVGRRPGRLLEAGCGVPQWVQFFDQTGHCSIGLDYADSGLIVGRKANPDLRLLRGDFRSLPFADDSFDYIVSFGAVEHDRQGPEPALREFLRVLKPGGVLMCSVPCLNAMRCVGLPWLVLRDWLKRRKWLRRLAGKTAPFEFYQYVWSPASYRRILRSCGFSEADLRPYGKHHLRSVMRAMDKLIEPRFRFFATHMMMAVCHKPDAERSSQLSGSR
jgi:SAM-dependent methyltransferase